MWRLLSIFRGLRLGVWLAAGGVAGAVTGSLGRLVAAAMVVAGLLIAAWDWERLREYNREDRY